MNYFLFILLKIEPNYNLKYNSSQDELYELRE